MKAILLFWVFALSNTIVFAEDKKDLNPEPKYAYAEVLIELYKDGRHEEYLKKSSGFKHLDEKILKAVKEAQFKPITNKNIDRMYLTQPFTIELSDTEIKQN
ncbi:energy transducer TonB family protein [Acinetobacter calcoaceticus]|uniref:TonB family protein n=1 Tax=Acinetobacter calcoaceticus TaxID=471 RepID=A0ABD5AKK6_ACICA|nr:energy transducer TonB [Acinetobacter calcoaceticus]MDP9802232.1 TonB family protein [Acinetobacter calcoaceticus]